MGEDDGGMQWFQQAGLEQQFNEIFKGEKNGNTRTDNSRKAKDAFLREADQLESRQHKSRKD